MAHLRMNKGPQFSAERQPPAGWASPAGLLTPVRSVMGYLARGQELKGHCTKRGCHRRCTIDLPYLASRGLDLYEFEILQLYRCNVLDRCALEFHAEPAMPNLPLRQLAGVPGIAARIKCRGCEFFRRLTIEEMIVQLKAAGRGGDSTCVSQVPGLLRSPCKICKKTSWDFDVLWPAENTMGWRSGIRP